MKTQHGTPIPSIASLPFAAPSLFDVPPVFDGHHSYDAKRDRARLTGQLKRAYDYLASHGWVTLADLARAIGCKEQSASARIRDLRKPRFGNHRIDREYVEGENGLHVYKLVLASAPLNEVELTK